MGTRTHCRSNEEDARSVSSRKSGSSSSVGGRKENSAPPADADEDEDLWSVWGELIRNWELEVKKRPAYIKVSDRPLAALCCATQRF